MANTRSRQEVTLEVLNPRGEIPPALVGGLSRRLGDLAGKKIGMVWNSKAGGEKLLDRIGELLKGKFSTATLLRFSKPGYGVKQPELWEEIAAGCNAFVYTIGD